MIPDLEIADRVTRPADLLRTLYQSALDAVQPEAAMRASLSRATAPGSACWIIATGKAAPGMAGSIVAWLAAHGHRPAGGLIVGPELSASPDPALEVMAGDHPVPGDRSARAARRIGELVARIPAGDDVHIAISGGTSALIAGPLDWLTMTDVIATFEVLMTAGLDIHEMNAVRKRVTRWSAGRLALALAGRRLHVWVISDVSGDNLGSIASGPCTGDDWTAARVRGILADHDLERRLPHVVQQAIDMETPKPGDRELRDIAPEIVSGNRVALHAIRNAAASEGLRARVMDEPLYGEAADMGRRIVAEIERASSDDVLIWGGETVVTMPDGGGIGGRSQELALAAAAALHNARAIGSLLAAGTDGRDGPTDATGAIVDAKTWARIRDAGRDPAADLAAHDSYAALDAAGALIRTGPTGTNVMDVAIALTAAPRAAP